MATTFLKQQQHLSTKFAAYCKRKISAKNRDDRLGTSS